MLMQLLVQVKMEKKKYQLMKILFQFVVQSIIIFQQLKLNENNINMTLFARLFFSSFLVFDTLELESSLVLFFSSILYFASEKEKKRKKEQVEEKKTFFSI